jgi:SPP1 gp7 family putative phage head morphogenesis protein
MARALRSSAGTIEQDAADEASAVVDANWPNLSAAERDAKLVEVEQILTNVGTEEAPKLGAVFKVGSDSIVPGTRKQLVRRYDLGIEATLTKRDEITADRLRETEALFVRNNYGVIKDKLSSRVRDIVAAGLEKGLGRDDISEDLADAMKAARRPNSYWNLIATTFCNRAHSFTQVHAMDEAGIRAFAVSAVMDEATSDICRFLDGKEFPVEQSVKRIKRVQESSDPEEIIDTMPWMSKGKNDDGDDILYYKKGDRRRTVCTIDESGEGERDKTGVYSDALATETLTKAGIGMPPYHGSCRSTIVPA